MNNTRKGFEITLKAFSFLCFLFVKNGLTARAELGLTEELAEEVDDHIQECLKSADFLAGVRAFLAYVANVITVGVVVPCCGNFSRFVFRAMVAISALKSCFGAGSLSYGYPSCINVTGRRRVGLLAAYVAGLIIVGIGVSERLNDLALVKNGVALRADLFAAKSVCGAGRLGSTDRCYACVRAGLRRGRRGLRAVRINGNAIRAGLLCQVGKFKVWVVADTFMAEL